MLSSINSNTFCQYLLNPNMDIPTTKALILFRVIMCTIIVLMQLRIFYFSLINSVVC